MVVQYSSMFQVKECVIGHFCQKGALQQIGIMLVILSVASVCILILNYISVANVKKMQNFKHFRNRNKIGRGGRSTFCGSNFGYTKRD